MSEKKNNTSNTDSSSELTKPVRVSKKVIKDQSSSETASIAVSENDFSEETLPVKKTRVKRTAITQSVITETIDSLEESVITEKPKKVRHGKWIWLGILIVLVITALGTGFGYWSALKIRMAEETDQRVEIATTQYVLAEQDLQVGNFDMAQKRLEYILSIYPDYPGLTDKLTEVMLANSLANPQQAAATAEVTPQAAITPVATKDTTVVSELFVQAQNQLTASDWQGLLDTVNKMRNIDPSYKAIEVDGMYYYALRYNAIAKIQAGKLETGVYYFTMAETIAPLDQDAQGWRNWASMFLNAGSWYGINYYKSAEQFESLYHDVPSMIDLNGYTAKQRYVGSLEGIGDMLMLEYNYCDAMIQYQNTKAIFADDELLNKLQQAEAYCANPPATPTPTVDPNQPKPTPAKK